MDNEELATFVVVGKEEYLKAMRALIEKYKIMITRKTIGWIKRDYKYWTCPMCIALSRDYPQHHPCALCPWPLFTGDMCMNDRDFHRFRASLSKEGSNSLSLEDIKSYIAKRIEKLETWIIIYENAVEYDKEKKYGINKTT